MADESFRQEFLESHNAYRELHNTPPMTLSSELNAAAQRWADHLLASGVLQHSGSKDGENIYCKWSSAPIKLTGKEAVDSWYGEVKQYSWRNTGFSHHTGHFTQVVWKASTHLGVGMATDGNKVIVIGQYRPAGNIRQYFNENVLALDDTQLYISASSHDYCPLYFHEVFKKISIRQLQLIKNAAIGVLTNTRKLDHITPVLKSQHWLHHKGYAFYGWWRTEWGRRGTKEYLHTV